MFEEQYRLWSTDPYFDEETRRELAALKDSKEIEDRFYTHLEFGTGGLRGILGAGTNRMNKYVIRKTTQGLAEYIARHGAKAQARGVVIAHDSRHYSSEFALEAALVLAGNGIKVYLFDALRPTPELSFAVRHLHTMAGIVVTASHNPKAYNGYKVYWEDGAQCPPEQADEILVLIEARTNWRGIEPMASADAQNQGLLQYIGSEVDRVYLDNVKGLALHPELIRTQGDQLSIVYTPLHGAGNVPVRRVLTELGFSSVFVVPEQEEPDPEFSTVPYPNPEIPSTLDLARKYGEARQADLLLATDPDSDRLGVVIREYPDGPFRELTGNQAGVFLTYYLLSEKQKLGILPEKAKIIKTIASTDLADAVAKGLGAGVESVLTGFKFIAEKEKEMEEGNWGVFQLGFEESYGYMTGSFVRDKDGVSASALFSEAALYYKLNGNRTIWQVMQEIYARFGHYMEGQESFPLPGKEGREEMAKLMEVLRSEETRTIGGLVVDRIDDYELRQGKVLATGDVYPLSLPKSNVLRFSFTGGGFVMARPSGTEPKIKFYFSVKNENNQALLESFNKVRQEWLDRVHGILERL